MDQPRPDPVPDPAIKRMSLYLRQLEIFQKDDLRTVSSKQLGKSLRLSDAQVRKDLAYFGQFGHPGIGYNVDELVARVRHILGTDQTSNVLLIGAGNLGRALSAYRGFNAKGFRLVAVFDKDPLQIGKRVGPFHIQPLGDLEIAIQRHSIRLAVMAVPAESAQTVAERLVEAGIRGLLNFAPASLSVPEYIAVQNVDLAVQLEQLSFQVNSMAPRPKAPRER